MALNVLSYLNEQFSSSVLDQLSTQLNETPDNTRTAMKGILPVVLGGLANRLQNGGANEVITALKNGQYSKETTPLDAAQVTDTREETQKAVENGRGFIQTVLGSNTESITRDIANFSGVQPASASSVMSLAGAVLMGLLGRQYREEGLTDSSLRTLILGQTDEMRAALPAGLSTAGELLGFDKFRTPTGPTTEVQGVDHFSGTPLNPNIPKSTDGDRQKENVRWLRWAMIVMAILVAGIIIQKCRQPQDSVNGVYTDTTRRAEPNAVEDTSTSTRQNVEKSNGQVGDSTVQGPAGLRERNR